VFYWSRVVLKYYLFMASNAQLGKIILLIAIVVFFYYFFWVAILPFMILDEGE